MESCGTDTQRGVYRLDAQKGDPNQMKISFHNAWHKKLMTKLGMLTILSTVFFLAMACASIPQETSVAGLFDQFEKTPQLLVRANTMFLRDMVASFDDATIESILTAASDQNNEGSTPIDRNRLDKTLTRANAVGIGVSWDDTQNPAAQKPDDQKLALEMVFAGNFPSLLTSLSFSFDNNWQRIDGGYAAKNGKLYLRGPSDGQLHFATWSPPNPVVPSDETAAIARQSGLVAGNADMAMYLDARSLLAMQLPILEGITLPFDGILMSATRDALAPPTGSPQARYSVVFRIQMKDEQTARTYKPIMKFMWVLITSRLSSVGIPISPDNSIEQHGDLFLSQPIAMSAQQIVDAALALFPNPENTNPKLSGSSASR